MSESAQDSSAESKVNTTNAFALPTKTIAWIAFLGLVIFLARFFQSWLDDQFGIGLDVINVVCYVLMLVIWISLLVHFSFFSKTGMAVRLGSLLLLIALPLFFVFALRPVLNGNVGIARFEPIWQKARSQVATPATNEGVDLGVESEFDFPRFLGTSQNAWVENPLLLASESFSSAENVWRQPIGEGWSGFAARNGFAVTMEQRGELECVTCYDIMNGKLQWIHEHEARHLDRMRVGGIGPRATPTIDEGRVYSMGAIGHFVCLDGASGEVIWTVDMNELLGIELCENVKDDGFEVFHETNTSLDWGRSGSPLIVGDKVIVAGGGPGSDVADLADPEDVAAATLIAFNKHTGEEVWRSGNEPIAYGSPTLVNVSTVSQVLLVAESLAMGFDPQTGEVLWEHPREGTSDAAANCSQVTVVSDNHILTSKGYSDGGGELIALEIEQGKLVPKSVWSSPRVLKTKFTNPIIIDGHSYSISNSYLECVDLTNGKRIWKHRKLMGNGQVLKSGNHLLVHSEKGVLHLVDPTPEGYRELGSFPTVKGVCWNTLCVYGPYLLVRSELEAACFKLPLANENGVSQPVLSFDDEKKSETVAE